MKGRLNIWLWLEVVGVGGQQVVVEVPVV